MAAFYDMNAAIDKPNVVNSLRQGIAFGTQQREMAQQEADRNALRELAPKIVAGDPDAYARASAIDPNYAQAQDNAGTNQLRKLKGGMDYLKQAMASGDPRRIAAAEAQVGPYVARIANKPWTPGSLTADPAAFEQAYARIAMLPQDAGQEPAGYRQAHLTAIAAGYQPGTPEYQNAMRVAAGTAARAVPAGYTTRTYRDQNGQEVVELVQTRGEGAGSTMIPGAPQGSPQVAPPQAPPADPQSVQADMMVLSRMFRVMPSSLQRDQETNARVGGMVNSQHLAGTAGDFPVPPEQKPQFIAAARQLGYEAIDEGDHVHLELPPQRTPALAGGPGRGQTDADRARAAAFEAAAKETAQRQVGLDFASREAEAAAAKEAAVVGARESAEAKAARLAALPSVIAKTDQTLSLINQALNHPGRTTATGASSRLDPRNYAPGTDATDFRVLLDQLKGQTFLEAFQSLKGGGAITQVEGQKAEQAIARLDTAQSDAAFEQALRDLMDVAESAKKRALEQAGDGAPQAPADDDEALIEKYL